MAFKTREKTLEDIQALVADADPAAWKQMWLTLGRSIPVSAITNVAYRGYNRWRLTFEALRRGYSSHRWLTKRQVHKLGGRVRDEEFRRDVLCEYWQFGRRVVGSKTDPTTGQDEDVVRRTVMVRPFWLYHVEQCEGLPDEVIEGPTAALVPLDARFEHVEAVIAATGARVVYGTDRACYIPDLDRVEMPDRAQFLGQTDEERLAHYYATHLHELGHWTGHDARLDRPIRNPFGSVEYADEELVAELCSAFLCADLAVPMADVRHPEYLAGWLERVRDKPEALPKAANAASRAADYILGFSREDTADDEASAESRAAA